MNILIEYRNQAKKAKDFITSDAIRDTLLQYGIQLKDSKEGTEWTIL
jgi:cysteinyl-tRNA synthetase